MILPFLSPVSSFQLLSRRETFFEGGFSKVQLAQKFKRFALFSNVAFLMFQR